MNKPKKFLTPKQKQLAVRKCQLISFRRWMALEGNGDAIYDYVDLGVFEMRKYIESFWLPGMNWDNYRKEWCVDHIIGLQQFDMLDRREMKLCWNHYNLQPAWMLDNHAKGYAPEIAEKILKVLPQTVMVKMLLDKVANTAKVFEKYYTKDH